MKQTNVTIRMGAAYHDVTIKTPDGKNYVHDYRKSDKRQNSDFHREFMNAFRARNSK